MAKGVGEAMKELNRTLHGEEEPGGGAISVPD
jgi:hypothetical protein